MVKKLIRLTESDLVGVIKSAVKKLLGESEEIEYRLTDLDELFGYMRMSSKSTGLPVDIFVDDGGAYKRDGHVPLIFIKNTYYSNEHNYIPISISKTPVILDRTTKINISQPDLKLIADFISANVECLILFANCKIGHDEFANSIVCCPSYSIAESKKIINEMASLPKELSNLPTDL